MTMRERLAMALVNEFNRQANEEIGYVSDLNGKEWFLGGLFDISKGIDAILAEMETPSEATSSAGIEWRRANMDLSYSMRNNGSYTAIIRAIREGT